MNALITIKALEDTWQNDPTPENGQALIDALKLARREAFKDRNTARHSLSKTEALASLGMTLEIGGHELARAKSAFAYNWRQLDETTQENPHILAMQDAFDILAGKIVDTQHLAVSRGQRSFTGADVEKDLKRIFRFLGDTQLTFDDAFRKTTFFGRQGRLISAFANIVANGIQAGQKETGDRSKARVAITRENGKVLIKDNGAGVPDTTKAYIFDPLFTEGKAFGSGVGLWLSRKIVEDMYGTLEILDTEGGACFAITLGFAITPEDDPT